MSLGDILLGLAALAALVSFITGGLALRGNGDRLAGASRYAALAAFGLITAAFVLLAIAFVTSDLSYVYVWSHSSVGLDAFYKLVGVWAGGEGGLVLWTWFMAMFLGAEVLVEKRRNVSSKYAAAFRMAATSIVLLFCLILLAAGLFETTAPSDLLLHPEGLGMNIALQTVEMAIHPPLVFAAYAACLMLFSICLARSVSSEEIWTPAGLQWAKIAGTLLLAGIAVGAVWAYYELGWGGFWVWDPVETASLLPLIAVIGFLHANRSRGAREGALMPLLGMLSFVFVLLASFITRTGGLWGSSVHTYGSSASGSIGARFVTVLTGDMTIMGLFTVIMVLFALSLILSYRITSRTGEEGKVDTGVLATVSLLMMYAALLLLLLVKNTGLDQGANFVEFTEKTTLLTFVMALLLLFGLLAGQMGKRKAMYAAGAVGLTSAGLAVLAAATGSIPWLVALGAPPAVAVIAASVYRMALLGPPLARWMGRAGGHAVHLGIALILLCFVVSSTMQSYLPDGAEALGVGDEVSLGGHTIQLTSLHTTAWTTSAGGAGEERIATFVVSSGSSSRTVAISNFYETGGPDPTLVRSGTAIINGLGEDVYLSYGWMDNDTALVQPRVVPLVSEVWLGFGIATLGMAATLVGRKGEVPGDLF